MKLIYQHAAWFASLCVKESMKYTLFKKLDFFAYATKVHLKFKPGRSNTENCNILMKQMLNPSFSKKYPKLQFSYSLVQENIPATLEIEINGKTHGFVYLFRF